MQGIKKNPVVRVMVTEAKWRNAFVVCVNRRRGFRSYDLTRSSAGRLFRQLAGCEVRHQPHIGVEKYFPEFVTRFTCPVCGGEFSERVSLWELDALKKDSVCINCCELQPATECRNALPIE